MKLFQSFMHSDAAASLMKGGIAIARNQPSLAPAAFGASVVGGVLAALIGGYKIADCIRYQTGAGQCDQAIQENAPVVATGVLALLGNWGAFNTYNKKLHVDDVILPESKLPPRELVEPNTFSFSAPDPVEIAAKRDSGMTQEQISDSLGISRYQVRKALKRYGELKQVQNKNKDRNKDRGR